MQHIEDAGVHSGDSACVLPPYLLKDHEVEQMRNLTRRFARELGVVGLINVQFAIRDGTRRRSQPSRRLVRMPATKS